MNHMIFILGKFEGVDIVISNSIYGQLTRMSWRNSVEGLVSHGTSAPSNRSFAFHTSNDSSIESLYIASANIRILCLSNVIEDSTRQYRFPQTRRLLVRLAGISLSLLEVLGSPAPGQSLRSHILGSFWSGARWQDKCSDNFGPKLSWKLLDTLLIILDQCVLRLREDCTDMLNHKKTEFGVWRCIPEHIEGYFWEDRREFSTCSPRNLHLKFQQDVVLHLVPMPRVQIVDQDV